MVEGTSGEAVSVAAAALADTQEVLPSPDGVAGLAGQSDPEGATIDSPLIRDVQADILDTVLPDTGEGSNPTKIQTLQARVALLAIIGDPKALAEAQAVNPHLLSPVQRRVWDAIWGRHQQDVRIFREEEVEADKERGRLRTMPNRIGRLVARAVARLPLSVYNKTVQGVGREAMHAVESIEDSLEKEMMQALESLRNGTPEMKALAAELDIARAQFVLVNTPEDNEEKRTEQNDRIAVLQKQRQEMKTDEGGDIAPQLVPMAEEIASYVEPQGKLPAGAEQNPLGYMQSKLAEAMIDEKARTKLIDGFVSSGKMTREEGDALAADITTDVKSVTESLALKAFMSVGGLGIALALILYFMKKTDDAAGQGARR